MGTTVINMPHTEEQIVEMVSAALEYAIELSEEEEGWKVEKEEGDAVVKVKKDKEGRKVWLCTAIVDIAPKALWEKLLDTDKLTTWNTTLTESRTIKSLDGDVEVSEQPEVKGCVRAEHGPGCQRVEPVEGEADKSKFIWLMDCDYKGMIPSSIIEIAMPSAQLQMIECIRKL